MASVFIIHGHDMEARNELAKFINSLGLEVKEFHKSEIQNKPMSMVLETVRNGIESADAVIALFTPDEHAASYDPSTGRYAGKNRNGEKWEGWQARPNVIFEAGMALGIAGDRTIIVKLGPVRFFSDLAGVLYIDLEEDRAKQQLRDKLAGLVEISPKRNWLNPRVSGNFKAYVRRRWDYYDELDELEKELRRTAVYGLEGTLMEMVEDIALNNMEAVWEDWTSDTFMYAIYADCAQHRGQTTDSAYWYLIIAGFLGFVDISHWWEPPGIECAYWVNSVKFSAITARGINLLYKIQRLAGRTTFE